MKSEKLTFKNDWSIRPDQHGTGPGTTCGSCGTLGVDSDVTGEDDGVPSVPGRGLDPVDCVEDGGSGAIAGILAIDTLDVVIARLCEKVHKGGLDRFGLVDDGFGANL